MTDFHSEQIYKMAIHLEAMPLEEIQQWETKDFQAAFVEWVNHWDEETMTHDDFEMGFKILKDSFKTYLDWESIMKEIIALLKKWEGDEEEEEEEEESEAKMTKSVYVPWDEFQYYFGKDFSIASISTFKKYVEDDRILIEYHYEDSEDSPFIRLRWRPMKNLAEFPYGKGHLDSYRDSSPFAVWWSQYDN